MPSWKKVIVSGSDASFNSLYVLGGATSDGGFTGSLFGTASQAISASYAPGADTAISASYAATASSADAFNVRTSLTASGLFYPTTDGLEGQVLKTDGSNDLTFGDVNTMYEIVYTGENITKSDPLYISGSQGANPIVYKADAANAAKMPVTYIASETIAAGNTTRGIVLGLIEGINLTGYTAGTEVYVAAGGGWTSTRPTGSAIVQVLGIVTKGGSGGKGLVLNPGPVELPNLQAGYAWVGDATGVPQAVSTSSLLVSTASFASTASYALRAGSVDNPFPYINPTTITGSISVPDNHNGLLVGPVSVSGSLTIGSGSSLLTVGPITSTISASYAENVRTVCYTALTGSTVWSIPHNFGCKYVFINVYNDVDDAITPYRINLTDNNTTTVYFTVPTAGTALLIPANCCNTTTSTTTSTTTVPPTTTTSTTTSTTTAEPTTTTSTTTTSTTPPPTTTTSTTTSTTTALSVWYQLTNCADSSTGYSQEYPFGTFAIDDRVTSPGSITWVVTGTQFVDPGGILYAITATGFTQCPTTTTTSTTTSTTTAEPTTTTSTTTSTTTAEPTTTTTTSTTTVPPTTTTSTTTSTTTAEPTTTTSTTTTTTTAEPTTTTSTTTTTTTTSLTFLVGFGGTSEDACNFNASGTVTGDNSNFCSCTTFTGAIFSAASTGTWYVSYGGQYVSVSVTNGNPVATVTSACVTCFPGTWSAGGAMITSRSSLAGAGTQNAALAFGGDIAPSTVSCTEEYSGASWSAGGALITARAYLEGVGTQNAALAFGGFASSPIGIVSCTEEYNGTSWSAGGGLINSRYVGAGAGEQNAALAFGGCTGIPVSCTEEYNGSSWSAGGALINARNSLSGAGTQNAGLAFGGGYGGNLSCTEEYNGTSWSAGGALITARQQLAGAGLQNAGLAFGGAVYPSGFICSCTEEYNGSSWSSGGALSTARRQLAGAGAFNAGIAFGGANPSNVSCTEEFSP